VDSITLGLDLLREMEQEVVIIRMNLKVAWDRQKKYTDKKRTLKEFKVGDLVSIRVKPKRRSLRTGNCAKFVPHYCGPFEVLERVGPMGYRLSLPPTSRDHNVFHVSLLKKYIHYYNHVIDWTLI
jgi:hypothetical protein